MENYNIESLSFLVGSFKDVIQSFGQNSKSVEFYKRQVNSLVAIGQVNTSDAQLVEEIVGMQNTNSVKWDSANKKLNQFVYVMNTIGGTTDKRAIALVLDQMVKSNTIDNSIESIVKKIYNIKGINIASSINFGELPKYNDTLDKNTKDIDYSKDNLSSLWKKIEYLINNYAELTIKVKNPNAVCSGDPNFFKCKVKKVLNYTNIIKQLACDKLYDIGEEKEIGNTDPCSHRIHTVFNSVIDAREAVDAINWKSVYDNKELLKRIYRDKYE